MRNGSTATVAGEFPVDDVEKQRRGETEDGVGGSGLAENAAVGQSDVSVEIIIDVVVVDCPDKVEPQLERSSASHEECRVCQDEKELLINLGCQCRGGLAKAHHSCIVKWFNTQGSNKCEICQQIAANVAPPDSQTSYWVWRVDPAFRAGEHESVVLVLFGWHSRFLLAVFCWTC